MNILYIYRAARFCPSGVKKDEDILNEVMRRVGEDEGNTIVTAHEDRFPQDFQSLSNSQFDIIIHQCRSKEALQWLAAYEQSHDTRIMNSPQAVMNNSRSNMEKVLKAAGLPTPESVIAEHPDLAGQGFWIKADDTGDSSEGHVRFVKTLQDEVLQGGELIQPHIPGRCVKFYGVGKSIFDLDIFGGDAIVTDHGDICIIDINDFPSFSSCLDMAAKAITEHIKHHETYFFYPDSLPLCPHIFCEDNSTKDSTSTVCGEDSATD